MGITKNNKIEPPNVLWYRFEGQYFVMLIFYGEGGVQCQFFAVFPEIKGKTLEEIKEHWRGGRGKVILDH